MKVGTRNPGPGYQRRPRRHPGPPVSAKALAAALAAQRRLGGRDDGDQPRPGQTPSRPSWVTTTRS